MAGPSTGAFNEAVATPGQLPVAAGGPGSGWLDKERIIAGPGFSRWVVPPAALAIHLCIGMAYGFSVFWLPLSKMLQTAGTGTACAKDMSFFAELFAAGCDWRVATLGWMYTLFSSAAPPPSGAAGSNAPARARPAW
jgi:hypothetical protein